jgi:3-dehydroquinate synthase
VFDTIQQQVQVNFRYPVAFTRGLFDPANPLLLETIAAYTDNLPKKLLIVLDAGVLAHHRSLIDRITAYCNAYPDVITLVSAPLIVPGGEQSKNEHELVEAIHDLVNEHGIDRHSYIMAVGGGAVIDMVGYAAATAHRGVRLIRVPTTVLAQNDAAVGVKNSVNAYGKKNWVGTFAPPYAVLNDFDFLETLEQRDWLSGISEAMKVALLKDPAFFEYIATYAAALAKRDPVPMEWVIYRCAQLHLEHIAYNGDPFEMGSSRPLDFGHWAAHKLEQLSNYRLRHGEAVAIGIALDSTYSYLMGMLSETDWERILQVFVSLGLAIYAPELYYTGEDDDGNERPLVLRGLNEFREHLGGELTIMLLQGIGRGVEVHAIDLDVMMQASLLLQQAQQMTIFQGVNSYADSSDPA